MQIDTHEFLSVAEDAGRVAVFDSETTGREADYHTVLVISIKPLRKAVQSFVVKEVSQDREVLRDALEYMRQFSVLVSYYGHGFDIPFLLGRCVRHNLTFPVRYHLDMYWQGARRVLIGRRSQAHLLEWIEAAVKKKTVSPTTWAELAAKPKEGLKVMKDRCESDCQGLEQVYQRFKPLVKNIVLKP